MQELIFFFDLFHSYCYTFNKLILKQKTEKGCIKSDSRLNQVTKLKLIEFR